MLRPPKERPDLRERQEDPMVFRDILLVIDTYPDPTPPSGMDDALAIAQALGARISALACAIMPDKCGRRPLLSSGWQMRNSYSNEAS